MKLRLVFVVSTIFVLYSWHPYFFEKNMFFNELLSLFGVYLFFTRFRWLLNDSLCQKAFPFLFIVFVYWIASLFTHTNTYVLFRSLSVFYSFFMVVVGYYIYINLIRSRIRWVYLIPVQPLSIVFGFAFIILGLKYSVKKFLMASFLVCLLYAIIFGGMTAPLSYLLCILVYFSSRKMLKFWVLAGSVFLLLFLFILDQSKILYYAADIYELLQGDNVLALDGNMAVRLLMWKEILFSTLPESYFMGIGFGSELFSESFIYFIGLREQLIDDPLLVYTLSPHNSFLYVLARTGVLGFFAIVYFYSCLWSDFRARKVMGMSSVQERSMFLIFIAFTFVALFNVVIESPIHSGLYWAIFGFYLAERNASVKLLAGEKMVLAVQKGP